MDTIAYRSTCVDGQAWHGMAGFGGNAPYQMCLTKTQPKLWQHAANPVTGNRCEIARSVDEGVSVDDTATTGQLQRGLCWVACSSHPTGTPAVNSYLSSAPLLTLMLLLRRGVGRAGVRHLQCTPSNISVTLPAAPGGYMHAEEMGCCFPVAYPSLRKVAGLPAESKSHACEV